MTYQVAAFYRFTRLENLPALQEKIKELFVAQEVCGTLLLAPEGVNSTIAAPTAEQMEVVINQLDEWAGIRQGELKYSTAQNKPFGRMKVRVKKEIITMRRPEADPTTRTGTYVNAEDWNALITRDDVLLLDTRNTYETDIGTFKNAVDPRVETFSEFADYVDAHIDPKIHKKVAVFCTGGIRDEKASSYLLHKGVEEVFQVKGGILKYLETVSPDESLWEGTCFIFDDRAAIGHGLSEHQRETRWPWKPVDQV